MRTTLTIPDSYTKDLLKYTHTKKMGEALSIVINEWLRMKKIDEIKKLRGKLHIEDNLATLKKKELAKLEKLHE